MYLQSAILDAKPVADQTQSQSLPICRLYYF